MMHIDELRRYHIPEEYLERLKAEGVHELYPPQEEAIARGFFSSSNLVLASPTASGKTLVATLGIIRHVLIERSHSEKTKILYIVPLKALAQEKFSYYQDLFKQDVRVALSIGDLDTQDPWLESYQLIITTSEKMDSLLRHGLDWISQVRLIIIDEVHLISDVSRGPTLEVLITLLRTIAAKAQVLGLSATVSNARELGQWLAAEVVESNFRPVPLKEGVCWQDMLRFQDGSEQRLSQESGEGILEDTLRKAEKQALFFVASRRSAESYAEKLSTLAARHLEKRTQVALERLSSQVLEALHPPTRQCQRLAKVVKKGVAFHHAGLVASQKSLLEDSFRQGILKAIVATPTLAMGVNLPAFRVILRDIKRYYPGLGSQCIPVLEYKQFAGRAGRPQYDKKGEAIIVAHSEDEAEELMLHYVWGKPEDIESKLAQETSLRVYALSLIASGFCRSIRGLLDFFAASFFGFQYQDAALLGRKLDKVILDLETWGFLEDFRGRLKATRLGERVSQLYLDPSSAHQFIEVMEKTEELKPDLLGLLHLVASSQEMAPPLKISSREFAAYQEKLQTCRDQLLLAVPSVWEPEFDVFLSSFKTALCFQAWIEEHSEDQLLEGFQIVPGELHAKLAIADWLAYCLIELTRILKKKGFIAILNRLRARLSYGVKEELLDLVALREIGRVRARRLFAAGIKGAEEIRKTPSGELARLLGSKIAQKVLAQLLPTHKTKTMV